MLEPLNCNGHMSCSQLRILLSIPVTNEIGYLSKKRLQKNIRNSILNYLSIKYCQLSLHMRNCIISFCNKLLHYATAAQQHTTRISKKNTLLHSSAGHAINLVRSTNTIRLMD